MARPARLVSAPSSGQGGRPCRSPCIRRRWDRVARRRHATQLRPAPRTAEGRDVPVLSPRERRDRASPVLRRAPVRPAASAARTGPRSRGHVRRGGQHVVAAARCLVRHESANTRATAERRTTRSLPRTRATACRSALCRSSTASGASRTATVGRMAAGRWGTRWEARERAAPVRRPGRAGGTARARLVRFPPGLLHPRPRRMAPHACGGGRRELGRREPLRAGPGWPEPERNRCRTGADDALDPPRAGGVPRARRRRLARFAVRGRRTLAASMN